MSAPFSIGWVGASKEELLVFPQDVRIEFGYNLWRLQSGDEPTCSYRSLATVKPGLFELREQDADGWYRLVYLTPIGGVIYVLHCFTKKSRELSKPDRELIVKRYRALKLELAEVKRGAAMTMMKGDIFDNLGLSHSEAAELRMRAAVLDAILRTIRDRGLTQAQLVRLLDEYQPNVSNLVHGKISKISLDKLVRYADRLGIQFNVTQAKSKKKKEAAYA